MKRIPTVQEYMIFHFTCRNRRQKIIYIVIYESKRKIIHPKMTVVIFHELQSKFVSMIIKQATQQFVNSSQIVEDYVPGSADFYDIFAIAD